MNNQNTLAENTVAAAIIQGNFHAVSSYIKDLNFLQNKQLRQLYQSAYDIYLNDSPFTKLLLYRNVDTETKAYFKEIESNSLLTKIDARDIAASCLYLVQDKLRTDIKETLASVTVRLNNSLDVFDALEELGSMHSSVNSLLGGMRQYDFMKSLYAELEEIGKRIKNPELVQTIKTGLTDFDRFTGGFEKGTLNIVAARPGMGKTALMIQFLYNIGITNKQNVLFFSLEMSESELIKRLLSLHTGITGSKIKRNFDGEITAYDRFIDKVQDLESNSIFLYDKLFNISEIISTSLERSSISKCDLIIIDYLQLIGGGEGENQNIKVGDITRKLKLLAKTCNCPVILLSQLSREVERRGGKKIPVLADLRDSGSIEQDADMVIFPYRPEYYGETRDEIGNDLENKMFLVIAKCRDGAVCLDGLRFDCDMSINFVGTKFENF